MKRTRKVSKKPRKGGANTRCRIETRNYRKYAMKFESSLEHGSVANYIDEIAHILKNPLLWQHYLDEFNDRTIQDIQVTMENHSVNGIVSWKSRHQYSWYDINRVVENIRNTMHTDIVISRINMSSSPIVVNVNITSLCVSL